MCQDTASLGRAVIVTLPLISALAFSALMFTPPICLATLLPSNPPSASPIAPVAFDVSEPVTFSVPVSGVASDSTSWAPVAVIGPREAVQPISAFCRICDIGLSALPAKWRGAPRSAASRMALSAIATGAMMLELRDAGGSGGNSTSTGAMTAARGHSQSMVFRLTKNEIVTIAIPSGIVLRFSVRRIVPRTDSTWESTGRVLAAPDHSYLILGSPPQAGVSKDGVTCASPIVAAIRSHRG